MFVYGGKRREKYSTAIGILIEETMK